VDTVVGVFRDVDNARDAISDLKDAGYSSSDISLLAPDRTGTDTKEDRGNKAPEGAVTGAVAGGILGGVGAWLVGLGALAIPGIGPVIAAGTLATALATTAAGAGIGAAAGGLIGALVGLGIPEEDAQFYAEGVKRGGVLVTVQTSDDRANDALNIMRQANAVDVDTKRSEWHKAGWNRFDEGTMPDASYPTFSGRPRTY